MCCEPAESKFGSPNHIEIVWKCAYVPARAESGGRRECWLLTLATKEKRKKKEKEDGRGLHEAIRPLVFVIRGNQCVRKSVTSCIINSSSSSFSSYPFSHTDLSQHVTLLISRAEIGIIFRLSSP